MFTHNRYLHAQAECEEVLDNDFFLTACKSEFVENARLFIFETYCRIHQCIDLKMLAGKLNMEVDAAEKWIVSLLGIGSWGFVLGGLTSQFAMLPVMFFIREI